MYCHVPFLRAALLSVELTTGRGSEWFTSVVTEYDHLLIQYQGYQGIQHG